MFFELDTFQGFELNSDELTEDAKEDIDVLNTNEIASNDNDEPVRRLVRCVRFIDEVRNDSP